MISTHYSTHEYSQYVAMFMTCPLVSTLYSTHYYSTHEYSQDVVEGDILHDVSVSDDQFDVVGTVDADLVPEHEQRLGEREGGEPSVCACARACVCVYVCVCAA